MDRIIHTLAAFIDGTQWIYVGTRHPVGRQFVEVRDLLENPKSAERPSAIPRGANQETEQARPRRLQPQLS
jgi:hypothetical protein